MPTPGAVKAAKAVIEDYTTVNVDIDTEMVEETADLIDQQVIGPIRERVEGLLREAEVESPRLMETALCISRANALRQVLLILNETEE